MSISASIAAKKICELSNWSVTNLRVQKILYLAHMAYLCEFDKPLINEQFEAWDYGPVIPSLYHQLKMFGSKPILDVFFEDTKHIDEEKSKFLIDIWDQLKEISVPKLVGMTHQESGAWAKYYKSGVLGIVIPNEDIKQEIKEFYSKNGK